MATKRKAKGAAKADPLHVKKGSALGIQVDETLASYTMRAMEEYGIEVIESRAVSGLVDGLKPVHRAVLWEMYKSGNKSTGGFRKSAKTVGGVIGNWHPHGDASSYEAMVNIAGTRKQGSKTGWTVKHVNVPLVEGQGNWGDFNEKAAAYRYSEARLSPFSDHVMLDPEFLAVADYIPNFDDSDKMPLVIPAKLPLILLNGYSSIGVGFSGGSPAFGLEGVLKLVRLGLEGKKITTSMCMKYLTPAPSYGGSCISSDAEYEQVLKGKGTLRFRPFYEIDEAAKTITFKSVCPGMTSDNTLGKFLNAVADLKDTADVNDASGKNGVALVVKAKRTLKGAPLKAYFNKVLDLSERSDSYDIAVSIREVSARATFSRLGVAALLNNWCAWRIAYESRVIAYRLTQNLKALDYQRMMHLARVNIEVVIEALRQRKPPKMMDIDGQQVEVAASALYLMKHLKISYVQAEIIRDLRMRQLEAIDAHKVEAKIKELETREKALLADKKNPSVSALRSIDELPVSLF